MVRGELAADVAQAAPGVPAQRRPPPAGAALWPPLALLVLAALALRLPLLAAPARPDEAGYLFVARQARPGGPELYGDLWVDRPPLLVGLFRAGDALGGLVGVRLLGLLATVALVLAAADCGRTLGGRRSALWAAAVAAALPASPLLGAPGVDGELLAVPFVLAGWALGLRVLVGPPRPRAVERLALAGLVAGCAPLVKQNLVGGLVLLGAVLLAQGALRRRPAADVGRLLLALLAGAAVPVLAALALLASWGSGPASVWDALVGFRSASLGVVATGATGPPLTRAVVLLLALVATGAAPLLLRALARRPAPGLAPVAVGLAATGGTAAVSVLLGGSYWLHYLVELVPAAALGAGLLAVRPRRHDRGAVALVLLSSTVAVAVATPIVTAPGCRTRESRAEAVAAVLRASARPGDTGLTLYGGSGALLGTGVRPAYPYLWSLPVRTLDPRLARLSEALSGPDAADWVVRSLPVGVYGLDADRRVRTLLREGYRPVARVCGDDVLLRDGLAR